MSGAPAGATVSQFTFDPLLLLFLLVPMVGWLGWIIGRHATARRSGARVT